MDAPSCASRHASLCNANLVERGLAAHTAVAVGGQECLQPALTTQLRRRPPARRPADMMCEHGHAYFNRGRQLEWSCTQGDTHGA